MRIIFKLSVAVAPLFLSALFAWFIIEKHPFSSEKDIVLAVPLLAWSLTFLLTYAFLWWQKFTFGRLMGIATAVATGLFLATSILLFGAPWFWFH